MMLLDLLKPQIMSNSAVFSTHAYFCVFFLYSSRFSMIRTPDEAALFVICINPVWPPKYIYALVCYHTTHCNEHISAFQNRIILVIGKLKQER